MFGSFGHHHRLCERLCSDYVFVSNGQRFLGLDAFFRDVKDKTRWPKNVLDKKSIANQITDR